MIISEDTLICLGAERKVYKKKDLIFQEGELPKYYFQILRGNVSLNNYLEDGKEFIQNFYNEGDSIHESALFDESKYVVNAMADSDCIIYRLAKVKFMELMTANSDIRNRMYLNSTKAIRFLMAKNLVFKDPVIKVLHIIDLLKVSVQDHCMYKFVVPFTRKQLASVTGLCVETVIRVIKKIEQSGKVSIINGKVYL